MSSFTMVGRRLIPREEIALVEFYEASANARLQTTKDFHARVIMVNRESVLIETNVRDFAEINGFRMLADDRVASNPAVHFRVETFLPVDGFRPAKAYMSRLLWRDRDGNEQSKLLLSEPETVLAVIVQGAKNAAASPSPDTILRKSNRKRRAPAPEAQAS